MHFEAIDDRQAQLGVNRANFTVCVVQQEVGAAACDQALRTDFVGKLLEFLVTPLRAEGETDRTARELANSSSCRDVDGPFD